MKKLKLASRPYRKESFSFRFTKLTPVLSGKLRQKLTKIKTESLRPDIVFFDIGKRTNLDPLYEFLETERLATGSYGLWVSVATSIDHGGVTVPGYILEIVRRTQCGIDFSFVACLGDDKQRKRLSKRSGFA